MAACVVFCSLWSSSSSFSSFSPFCPFLVVCFVSSDTTSQPRHKHVVEKVIILFFPPTTTQPGHEHELENLSIIFLQYTITQPGRRRDIEKPTILSPSPTTTQPGDGCRKARKNTTTFRYRDRKQPRFSPRYDDRGRGRIKPNSRHVSDGVKVDCPTCKSKVHKT